MIKKDMNNSADLKKGMVFIDLETAKTYHEKGGEFKEIALKAGYTESELRSIKNEWGNKFKGKNIEGYCLDCDNDIIDFITNCVSEFDKDTFKTEAQARSALAYAQITQLMALPEYNGDWVPDWDNDKQVKYIIVRFKNKIIKDQSINSYFPIAFKSASALNKFFENNYDLLKEYFQL